jgi:hypothetical protein
MKIHCYVSVVTHNFIKSYENIIGFRKYLKDSEFVSIRTKDMLWAILEEVKYLKMCIKSVRF